MSRPPACPHKYTHTYIYFGIVGKTRLLCKPEPEVAKLCHKLAENQLSKKNILKGAGKDRKGHS